MSNKKESVALSSIIASAGMAAMKLVVGLMTGSLGIMSEAAHSLLDLGAATLTWFAVRVSDQPADAEHPYGHGKIENVSALIETGLLFITSAWIVKEAVERLLSEDVHVSPTWYAAGVMVVSIIIDYYRARALNRVAKETGSQALEADALHFTSDIWSSSVVLLGLGFVALGWPKADAIAAIGVAIFVCLAGWRLGRRTVDVLIDTAPEGVAEVVAQVIEQTPGVARIEQIRARPAGATVFVEAVVKVSRGLSLQQVQAVRDAVRDAIRREMPNIDPLIVAEPLTLDNEDVAETVRIAAADLGYNVHDIGLYTLGNRRHVGFDLEVDEDLSIAQAHDVATTLENVLAAELGGEIGIDIHIDPRRNHVEDGQLITSDEQARILAAVEDIARAHPLASGIHHLFAQRGADGVYVSFHCVFPAESPIRAVHDVTAQMEHELRARIPDLSRVVIHAEPIDHLDREEASSSLAAADR